MIKIYTDGSCLNNPGNGGWAAIIIKNDEITEISGNEKNTTNNRMELLAPISALNKIKDELEPYFDEMEAEGLIPAEISVPFVEKILDRQKCICGREIGENEKTTINDLFENLLISQSSNGRFLKFTLSFWYELNEGEINIIFDWDQSISFVLKTLLKCWDKTRGKSDLLFNNNCK